MNLLISSLKYSQLLFTSPPDAMWFPIYLKTTLASSHLSSPKHSFSSHLASFISGYGKRAIPISSDELENPITLVITRAHVYWASTILTASEPRGALELLDTTQLTLRTILRGRYHHNSHDKDEETKEWKSYGHIPQPVSIVRDQEVPQWLVSCFCLFDAQLFHFG